MPADLKQPLLTARQQLTSLIRQIKEEGQQENLLPTLETVLTELDNMARHDHLTGALNRRTLISVLESELARSLRTGHTFSFAVISVDALEQILEQHGQAAARQVLRRLADEAGRRLRTLDAFGRVAANEFAIVMPGTWLVASLKAIARLQAGLRQADWSPIAPALSITFCSGVTTNAQGDSAEGMLQRALDALQQARASGPGSVASSEPPLPGFDTAAPE
ncbi:MAG: GGDEF domain-containing protein [Burkholderiales bacterium]|nr:GGDEF domain-containing protein [Burkholderiales bacterium]